MTAAEPRSHRILVIDDNSAVHDDFRKILLPVSDARRRLDAFGAWLTGGPAAAPAANTYRLDAASQGQQGLALVNQAMADGDPYFLAFVDIRMPPGWDGLETIKHLWQVQPDLQVVICTAYSDFSWDDISKRLGDTDNLLILRKPFDNIEVLQIAKALTRKWVATREAELSLANLASRVAERTRELVEENNVRRQTEEALRASEERFRTVFMHSPLGIVTCDHRSGNFLSANPAFCAMLEYSEAELRELTVEQVSLPEDYAAELTRIQQLLGGADSGYHVEKRYRCKSGRVIWANLGVSIVRDNSGQPMFAIGAVADITERKRAEAERHKLDQQMQQAQRLESLGVLQKPYTICDLRKILSTALTVSQLKPVPAS